MVHGYQILAECGPDWLQMGRDFFQDRFSTFWLVAPKYTTESDLKIPGFVPFGTNLTLFEPKSGHHAIFILGQGRQSWPEMWSDWHQLGLIWDF